ncbi:MAG: porin, partial [Thiohalocapsa sp.]
SQLQILDVTPTATYRITDNLALSAGADVYLAKSAELDSSLTRLDGDGSGWGFNLSALYVREALSVGVNFHSAANVRLEGFYTATNPLLVRAGRLNPSQSAVLDLHLPWRLQLGARYELMPRLAVELDWTRTGWSEFDEIKIKSRSSGQLLLPPDQNRWEDANAYRLGGTYDLAERTQLRFGYSYDETGQDDDHFSARVPDNNRHLFSLGVRQMLGDGWQVEAGYMYAKTIERNVRGTRPYDLNDPAEINGTDAIAGSYQADVHLVGLEINKGFDAF